MFYKPKPSIKQINRYLKPVVESLLTKHGKVSNPDFEIELRQLTGIGWKQVKNYRNHPRPHQKIHDNSKIQQFIAKKWAQDRLYQVKIIFIHLLILLLLISVVISIILGIIKMTQTPQENLKQMIDNYIEQRLPNTSLRDCKRTTPESIECPEGKYLLKKELPIVQKR